jgi:hypothetical protein
VIYAASFPCAHLAFIIADNFFRIAALIGFLAVDFLDGSAGTTAFLWVDLPSAFPSRLHC